MLRRQELPTGPLSFLAGRSAMAAMIASRDWSQHPLGAPEQWPQSLRSALSICLNSAFPTAIYWGNDLRLLYNDAWAPIPGPRHPRALGAPAREVWTDIWSEIEPQLRHLIETGDGVYVEDRLLPMARFGIPEETYWSYSFTPIRGEDGRIAGIFNSGNETTGMVLSNQQMRFLLRFAEELRGIVEQQPASTFAVRALCEHLHADCALLLDIGHGLTTAIKAVHGEFPSDTTSVAAFAASLAPQLIGGITVRLDDATSALSHPHVGRFPHACGLASLLAVPYARPTGVTAIVVAATRPRVWSEFAHTTVSTVLERLCAHAEHLLLDERERLIAQEIDHRARNALTVANAIVRQTLGPDGGEAAERVQERLGALSRTHALLARERWNSVDLAALIREELAAFEPTTIRLDGPSLPLPPQLAQTLALIVHELTTNSVKYGALGASRGQLHVTWQLDRDLLTLHWHESAPSAAATDGTSTGGFGTTLIDRLVGYQLRGTITRHRDDEGFHCRIQLPF